MSEAIDRINALQRRILAGEDPTPEEMHEVIKQLRSERSGVSAASAKRKTPAPEINLADIFGKKE